MGSTFYSYRYRPREGRNRKPRPKSFATEEAAQKWAEKTKLEKFSIVKSPYDGTKYFVMQ